MMRTSILSLITLLAGLSASLHGAYLPGVIQTTPEAAATPTPLVYAEIRLPLPGHALQGSVPIEGAAWITDFLSAELLFAYTGDTTGTWFLITELSEPVEGFLAEWDTTTLADGEYTLRLLVLARTGEISHQVEGLRVRNYTVVETNTPTPVTPTYTLVPGALPVPTETPTPTITSVPPTPTELPPNPADISRSDVIRGAGLGGAAVVGFFALLGMYHQIKTIIRKDRTGRDI